MLNNLGYLGNICCLSVLIFIIPFTDIGEFSEIAVWKDPTVSYIVPQIICKACNHCRDIDLGRDQYRSDSAWLCPLCNTPYDSTEIECIMLDIISKKFLAYNLQDLQCKKCKEVRLKVVVVAC